MPHFWLCSFHFMRNWDDKFYSSLQTEPRLDCSGFYLQLAPFHDRFTMIYHYINLLSRHSLWIQIFSFPILSFDYHCFCNNQYKQHCTFLSRAIWSFIRNICFNGSHIACVTIETYTIPFNCKAARRMTWNISVCPHSAPRYLRCNHQQTSRSSTTHCQVNNGVNVKCSRRIPNWM